MIGFYHKNRSRTTLAAWRVNFSTECELFHTKQRREVHGDSVSVIAAQAGLPIRANALAR